MPRVPTYDQQKVRTAPLTGGRRRASAETFESAGGPIAQGQEQLARAQGQFGDAIAGAGAATFKVGAQIINIDQQVKEQRQEQADQVAALSADRKASELALQLETEGRKVRGKEAGDVPRTALEAFDKQTSEIDGELTNERQRQAFMRSRNARRLGLQESLYRHADSEIEAYETGEVKAAVATSAQTAIANAGNNKKIQVELDHTAAIVEQQGNRLGLVGPEARAAFLRNFRSDVHIGIIERLIDENKDRQARAYFEEMRDAGQIVPDKLGAMSKRVEEASTLEEGLRLADSIFASTTSRADALEAAGKITDGKVRLEAEQQLTAKWARKRDDDRQREDDLMDRITQKVVNGQRVLPSELAALSSGHRLTVDSFVRARSKAGQPRDPDTDWSLYFEYSRKATGNPKEQQEFADLDLRRDLNRLHPTEFKHLVDMQGALRKGDRAAVNKLGADEATQTQIVNQAIISVGLDPTPTESTDKLKRERVVEFRRSVRGAVARLETRGTKATNAEVQAITDTLLVQPGATRSTGTFFGSTPAYAFEVGQAQVADVERVPAARRRSIETDLRRDGIPVTPAAVLRVFNFDLANFRGDYTPQPAAPPERPRAILIPSHADQGKK